MFVVVCCSLLFLVVVCWALLFVVTGNVTRTRASIIRRMGYNIKSLTAYRPPAFNWREYQKPHHGFGVMG